MGVDAKAIITFGFYGQDGTQFMDRVMTFGWWDGVITVPPLIDGDGNALTVKVVGQHKV